MHGDAHFGGDWVHCASWSKQKPDTKYTGKITMIAIKMDVWPSRENRLKLTTSAARNSACCCSSCNRFISEDVEFEAELEEDGVEPPTASVLFSFSTWLLLLIELLDCLVLGATANELRVVCVFGWWLWWTVCWWLWWGLDDRWPLWWDKSKLLCFFVNTGEFGAECIWLPNEWPWLLALEPEASAWWDWDMDASPKLWLCDAGFSRNFDRRSL